jgi:hypothetical protein
MPSMRGGKPAGTLAGAPKSNWKGLAAWRAGNNPLGVSVFSEKMNKTYSSPFEFNRDHPSEPMRGAGDTVAAEQRRLRKRPTTVPGMSQISTRSLYVD